MTTSPVIPDGVMGLFLWTLTMIFSVLTASSLLAVLLGLGWAKEFRLRRALQFLLTRTLTHWKKHYDSHHSTPPTRKFNRSNIRTGHSRLR
jgi:hypothetical protein